MVRSLLVSLAALACLAAPPRTLRVDYGHTGNAAGEHFGVDRVVLEPLAWPGDLAQAIDHGAIPGAGFRKRCPPAGWWAHARRA